MYQDLQSSFTKDFTSKADNSAQSIVGVAGTAIKANNVIDMGKPANTPRQALGQNPYVNVYDASCIPVQVQVVENLVGATGGVKVDFINSSTEDLTGTPKTIYTATIAAADFKVGYELAIKELPMGITQRFLGITFTPLATASTAGKVEAFVTTAKDLPKI